MTFDKPGCFNRNEQVLNQIFHSVKKVIRVQLKNKCSPSIQNIEVTAKDVEEAIVIPKEAIAFSIRDRGNARIKYAYETGQVEGGTNKNFIQLGVYGILEEDFLNLDEDLTIFFSSSKDNRTIELIYWT